MKQYCRYCSHMCCGDANYCEIKNFCFKDSTIKAINHCEDFEFNPIDALNLDHKYKPRPKKVENKNQITIEEMLENEL